MVVRDAGGPATPRALPRLAPGGRRYAGGLALLSLPAAVGLPPAGLALAAGAVAVALFYRDPERTPPDEAGVLAPCDGHVSVVREEEGRLRVGTFMSPLDVHVVRAPTRAYVESASHDPGGHWPAFSKASERNERLTLAMGDHDVTLIAGALARRITAYVGPGDTVERGDRVGHVAFGSRTDVLLPPSYDRADLRVAEGDRVRAGETVIATQHSGESTPSGR
jgi:phosphatidylserine decarboxylase